MLRVVAADGRNVGQRLATLAAACAVAGVVAAAAAGSAKSPPNWAAPQIATVVAHKLMGAKNVKKFRPNAALTNKTLTSLAADLKAQLGPAPPPGSDSGGTTTTGTTTTSGTTTTTTTGGSDPAAPETMAQLDKSLVQAIGLKKAASEFVQGARADGLAVPSRFGTEVVARLLGLRLNHPGGAGLPRAAAAGSGDPRRNRLLGGADPQLRRARRQLADRPGEEPRRHLQPPGGQRLAAPDPRRRLLEDRDAVRLGRDERQHGDRVRRHRTRRLRLLGLRLARLQAPELRGRGHPRLDDRRAGRRTR